MASNESPRTPEQSKTQPEYDTGHRSAYFWRRDHMKDGEKVSDVAEELGIPDRTGRRWMRERKLMGTPTAKRRVRKNKAASKGSKLGRPWSIPQEVLNEMVGPSNPLRNQPLLLQARHYGITQKERTIQYNLKTRKNKAQLYVAGYTKSILDTNKSRRVKYGVDYKDEPIIGFWDLVHFTDEAHFNPTERLQKPRILRERGTRDDPDNVVEVDEVKSGCAVHIYAHVNWYYKSPLRFYNDEKDMLPTPKPPPKPRKSKYETQETYDSRVREWEANKPPKVKQDSTGNHMTQKYYSEKVLPQYIKAVHKARMWQPKSWVLQEDNDPSHGTRSTDNDAALLKMANWIVTIIHPAQSPDLNPTEGCWNILKERTKRRLWRPRTHPNDLEDGEQLEEEWDGTTRYLKKILQAEWDKITLEEIRKFIKEMPWRCEQVIRLNGRRVRSALW